MLTQLELSLSTVTTALLYLCFLPQVKYGVVYWRGEEYRTGTCVFLTPTAFRFKTYGNVFKGFKSIKSEKVINYVYCLYFISVKFYQWLVISLLYSTNIWLMF